MTPPPKLQPLIEQTLAWLSHWASTTLAGVAVLILVASVWRVVNHIRFRVKARVVTIEAPPEVDPAGATAFWANMIGLLRPCWIRLCGGQPYLAFEYRFSQDGVAVQLWVPGVVPPGMIDRAIEAAWPGAKTTTNPATPPLPNKRKLRTFGGRLQLARHEATPIRSEFTTDPLRPLLGALTGLGRDETACVQILARPATGRRTRRARQTARRIRAGHTGIPLARLIDAPIRPTRSTDPQGTLDHSARDRAIVAKQRDNQFDTAIRYAITTTRSRRQSRGRTHAIAAAFAGFAHHNFYRRRRLLHARAVLAGRWLGTGDLLSVPELAALAHIPYDAAMPGLHRASAKAVAPSPSLATSGPDIKPLGIADTGQPRPIGLRVADGRHHVHIMGATGSGKSELMARMILADADQGRGVVVVDPKGDLIDDILARLPARFADRITLLDSDNTTRHPVLNPLDGPDTDSSVDNLVSIFSRVYAASWGPRTDDLLRSRLLTLQAMPGTPTLLDLPKLLTVSSFRQRARKKVHDEILAGFWAWYDELSDASRAQVAAPLMNKLRGLLLRPFVRATLTGGRSTVDMTRILDGGICLVRLAKGTLSTDTVRLMGSIVVAHVWQAATLRSQLPKPERRDCALYLDEFQNFLNLAYPPEEMLPEARAYGLSLVLAHHNHRQLSRELQEAMSVNARNKIFFNASPEDARRLAHHTAPHLSEHDLTNLGRYQVALRLVSHSQDTPACTARTQQLPPPIPGRAEHLRALAKIAEPSKAPEPQEARDPRRAA
jgi:hypothetical protein